MNPKSAKIVEAEKIYEETCRMSAHVRTRSRIAADDVYDDTCKAAYKKFKEICDSETTP